MNVRNVELEVIGNMVWVKLEINTGYYDETQISKVRIGLVEEVLDALK